MAMTTRILLSAGSVMAESAVTSLSPWPGAEEGGFAAPRRPADPQALLQPKPACQVVDQRLAPEEAARILRLVGGQTLIGTGYRRLEQLGRLIVRRRRRLLRQRIVNRDAPFLHAGEPSPGIERHALFDDLVPDRRQRRQA